MKKESIAAFLERGGGVNPYYPVLGFQGFLPSVIGFQERLNLFQELKAEK